MQEKLSDRELIVLHLRDCEVRGTYHRPVSSTVQSHSGANRKAAIGVLLLNGMYVTRAANGDAAVYWASCFASCGYPCFRIDLPGLGDSEGEAPKDWLGFINSGGYATVTCAIVDALAKRFDLAGVVLIGHCSGAVSAIYAAAALNIKCKGLVLMDPYFHLAHVAAGVRDKLSLWALKGRIGRMLSRGYDFVKEARLRLRGTALPPNANVSLLRCFKQLASNELPILLLKSPSRRAAGVETRIGEFDYLQYLLERADRNHKITISLVEGASHTFSNHLDRLKVRLHVEPWLKAHFEPIRQCETSDQWQAENNSPELPLRRLASR
jgi:pimeloyl-ACP methyl ester carboxylesterase